MNGQLYRLMLLALAALLTAALISGCAAPPPPVSSIVPPPLSVPWAIAPRPAPDRLLADADLYFPRGEKFVYGSLPLAQVSSYSELTFDAQPIGTKNNTGYRYRWVYRSAVTAP